MENNKDPQNANKPEPPKPLKKEVQIKLITDLTEDYQLTQNVFNVPLEITSLKLNELINKLLRLETQKNFSFFINGLKLSEPLLTFTQNNSISTESLLEVYYMFELNEPQKTNTIKEDEWIRKIELLNEMKFTIKHKDYCVGLFNGEVSFYNGDSNEKIYTIKPLNESEDNLSMLTGLKFYKNNKHNYLLRTMTNSNFSFQLYDIDLNIKKENLIYYNTITDDENFVNCEICPTNYNIFSICGKGNNKGLVKIFKLAEETEQSSGKKSANKKRKIEGTNITPIYSLDNLHKTTVQCTSFLNGEYFLTGGDDYILNLYNIETKNLFMNFNTNFKDFSCFMPIDYNTFLAGYMDGSIGLYDFKAKNSAVGYFKDRNSMYGFISELCLSNDKDNHPNTFVSSSYDSYVKLWDIRGGSLPIYKVKTENTEKNYTAKFNGVDTILCGGDGSAVNVYSF